ncbi:hypothetical protein DFH09DRAFT_1438134 [Mycena vulgaris]|nr:hypothetical protein DFH09DRAFT_1438134 [Mycena vulgaris]
MYAPSDSPPDEEGATLQTLDLDGPERETTPHSRMPTVDLEGSGPPLPLEPPCPTGVPYFEPLGEDDVYDVFDLELALTPGGKEAAIDARYRSSDSSSGRPTYKIQKKTKAHFLGKKNMTVEVLRSLGWDSGTATPTLNGSKGYTSVFSARDQQSRGVALTATNSVLSKSSLGGTVAVSSVCGMYDPSRAARQSSAHHFFALKLNEMGGTKRPAPGGGTKSKRAGPAPPPAPSPAKPYAGGGHFVLDSAPRGRTDLLSTIYCTGYDQRPVARAGDIVVAELRVRPAAPGAPPAWARFFKERHAALHIARRGVEACMSGPHVDMRVPGGEPGRRAVLARGQALEVVLAALGTALLAVEHDGLEGKHWAWLVQQHYQRVPKPALALAPAPTAADNPGLASPDGEGTDHSDDSQGPASSLVFERGGPGSGLFVGGQGYTPSLTERRSYADAGSIAGSVGSGIELEEWIGAEDVGAPMVVHTIAPTPEAPRTGGGGGTWARKTSIVSERSAASEPQGPPPPPSALGPHHHFKTGSWPQKNRQSGAPLPFERREPLIVTAPEPKSPTFSRAGSGWADAHAQNVVQEHGEDYMFS